MAALLSYCSVCVVELATVIYVMRRVCLPAQIARVKYIVLIVVKVRINTLHAHHTIRYPLPAILYMNSSDSVSSQSNKSSTSLVASLPNENHAGTSGNADPWDDNDDITDSPNTSQAFMEASMVMTLAEKFDLTRFRKYQKEAITALLSGQDCLVVQPTGSGKSLCFQFPAVHQNKISIVITPTISLMQDHVKNCELYGIKAAYFGSAQLDLHMEERILSTENSDISVVLVTPEWIARADKKAKLQRLVDEKRVCLIALDEAHLFHYWQEFRNVYKTLESLKHEFPSTPLLCLTATIPPVVEDSIRYLLRNPVISKASVDRPNIMLACEEIPSSIHQKDFSYFASRVSDMLQSDEFAIVYTDFIDDVGPIMSELSNHGIDSVACYGEMDIRSRNESFDITYIIMDWVGSKPCQNE